MVPADSAATRTFCVRPRPALESRGCTVHVAYPAPAWLHRAMCSNRGVLRHILQGLYWYGYVLTRRLVQLPSVLQSDAVIVQRSALRQSSWPVFEIAVAASRMCRGRPRLIVQCDDALFAHFRRPMTLRFRLADGVVTGNSDIAAFADTLGTPVRMVEAGIPVSEYPAATRRARRPVKVGWVGTNAGAYLRDIEESLARVCDGRRASLLVISGDDYSPDTDLAYAWRRWQPAEEFSAFADIDIGLMPLRDTEYNRGKEAYKLKEYAAAGIPCICSPVGRNRDVVVEGVTGFFASTPEDWDRGLEALIGDEQLRNKMGAAARVRARRRFDLGPFTEAYADAVLDLALAPARQRSSEADALRAR
jgi:hypothetical protein